MTAGRSSYGWKSRSTRLSAAAPWSRFQPSSQSRPLPSEITTTRVSGCDSRSRWAIKRQHARIVLQTERARVQHHRVAAQARARPPVVVGRAHGQLVYGCPVGDDGRLVGDAPGGEPFEERRRNRHDRGALLRAIVRSRRSATQPTSGPSNGSRRRAADPMASEYDVPSQKSIGTPWRARRRARTSAPAGARC